MKKSLFIFLLPICIAVHSQQLAKVCYDSDDEMVDEVRSEYCVVGKIKMQPVFAGAKDSSWHFVDTVRAFYSESKTLKFLKIFGNDGLEHGNYIEYYSDKKIKERGAYQKGRKVGIITVNYPSGKSHHTLHYFPPEQVVTNFPGNYKIQSYFDSVGNQLVKGGSGYCNCTITSSLREVGKVKDGLRDSIWSAYKGDTVQLMESYHEGRFIDGVRFQQGTRFRYTKFQEEPSYVGGYAAMMEVIKLNMKYPANARRKGIEGTILTSFVVTKNGTITDIKTSRGIDRECDEEARRVVALLKNWNPGRQRGKPVSVRFNLPLKFNLD